MTRDLFGDEVGPAEFNGSVVLALVVHDESPKAWLLGETEDGREAQWVPKSQVKRGEGRDENVWTVPSWLARDRGWV